jgi:hypothetical protein
MFRWFYHERLSHDERGKALFTALGGLKDSSYLINYLCSKALDEEEKKGIGFQGLESMIKTRGPQETIPIFLDDNIGSVKQSVRIFQEWLGIAQGRHRYVEKLDDNAIQWLRQAKLFYFVLTGFEEGMDNLRSELAHNGLSMTIHPAMKTRKDIRCFQAGKLIFDNETDRLEAREMARSIGYELLKDKDWPEELRRERSLGYGNSQKLIVFSYNTPTCTLRYYGKGEAIRGRNGYHYFRGERLIAEAI